MSLTHLKVLIFKYSINCDAISHTFVVREGLKNLNSSLQ